MFFDLNDKKVFLTGSTGTIGSSIASVFNKSGATLICTSTSKSKLTKLKEIIGEKHFFYLLDLKNNKELDNRLDEIIKAHNDINVIINNAGYKDDNLSLRMKEEQWNDVININLTSNYKIIKKIAPSMIKAKYGRIIGISSVVAFTGNKGQSNYSASKSGMIGLYKSLIIFGLFQAIATLGFSVLAALGNYISLLMIVISLENLAAGMGYTAYLAFIANMTNKEFTATQFALMTALMSIPRTFFSGSSGYLVEMMDWQMYFIFCSLIAIPALIILMKIKRDIKI